MFIATLSPHKSPDPPRVSWLHLENPAAEMWGRSSRQVLAGLPVLYRSLFFSSKAIPSRSRLVAAMLQKPCLVLPFAVLLHACLSVERFFGGGGSTLPAVRHSLYCFGFEFCHRLSNHFLRASWSSEPCGCFFSAPSRSHSSSAVDSETHCCEGKGTRRV